MNSDILAGKWEQLKGRLREVWGDLTDSDIERAHGNYEKTVGLLQEKYGQSRDEIEKKLHSIDEKI